MVAVHRNRRTHGDRQTFPRTGRSEADARGKEKPADEGKRAADVARVSLGSSVPDRAATGPSCQIRVKSKLGRFENGGVAHEAASSPSP